MSTNISATGNKAAGIDIGSNSVRMIIAEVSGSKILRIISSRRETSRLATGICDTKRIAEVPFKKSIEILKRYKKEIDSLGITKVKAVATSAVRESENGGEFINACKNIGIPAEIITGQEEAKLCFKGVKAGTCTGPGKVLIFDTGGGSTEFTVGEKDDILFTETCKIGVVKMTDKFDMKDAAPKNLPLSAAYIKNFFQNIRLPEKCEKLIATAGTAASLAAMSMKLDKYDPEKINGYVMKKNEIGSLLSIIVNTSFSKRKNIPGLETGREDLIIPGIQIILEVMDKTGFENLTVSDYGLREGAVVAAANP